jgi:hypothetical protein
MARITLYIPDDLKTRMDAAENEINWSEVTRPILTATVTAFEHKKGRNMTTAIERLRASKQKAEHDAVLWGKNEGREWAADKAEYRWLQRLSNRRKTNPSEKPRDALRYAVDLVDETIIVNPEEIDELYRNACYPLSRGASGTSDEYFSAFIEGAVGFFDEIREEVERK